MPKDVWLPKGYELADGSRIGPLRYSGDSWQIYATDVAANVLLARDELAARWCEIGLLEESLLSEVSFGAMSFRSLTSHERYSLAPVDDGRSHYSKADAIAFSLALKESRELSTDVSFHDAIFLEQYSRLLPTWTLTPHVEDEVVLGTWLAGGVVVPTGSFRRLAQLTGWMPPGDLAEIIRAAGLHVSSNATFLSRSKRKPAGPRGDEPARMDVNTLSNQLASDTHPAEQKGMFELPGRPHLEKFFNEHVVDIIFNAERYQALGIFFPSAIALHGPPGCGKTYAVEKLVEFIDWPCFSINSNSVGSPYIHETSKKISEVFDKAIDAAPAVVVIDEMESFLSDRRSAGSSGLHRVEEVAEFLRRIPEAIESRVLIFAMTNMIDLIDPAILRRGRFDHIVEVGMPSRQEVVSLLESLLRKIPKSEDLDLEGVLDKLTGKALSDSAFVVREAARLAAKAGKTELDQESIDAALSSIPEDDEREKRSIGFGEGQ